MSTAVEARRTAALDRPLGGSLLSLSMSGLPSMFDAGAQLFCERIVRSPAGVSRQGLSERYTAMTLLGLSRYEQAGHAPHFHVRDLATTLLRKSAWSTGLGDIGVFLWMCAEVVPELVDECRRRIDAVAALERSEQARTRPTMELAWFLTGLAKAACVDASARKAYAPAARTVFGLLKANQRNSGFFGHLAADVRSKARLRARIGSFADQVYPIYASTAFAAAFGADEALRSAEACADAICEAQGPLGQWWWHYDSVSGRVVQRYPVYSVHQEGMAPMALLSLEEAAGRSFTAPVLNGLQWILGANELNLDMRNAELGVVWRSLRFESKPRLVQQELRHWRRAGNTPAPVDGLTVLHECRPYELGWLLYAWSSRTSASSIC